MCVMMCSLEGVFVLKWLSHPYVAWHVKMLVYLDLLGVVRKTFLLFGFVPGYYTIMLAQY